MRPCRKARRPLAQYHLVAGLPQCLFGARLDQALDRGSTASRAPSVMLPITRAPMGRPLNGGGLFPVRT
jgi:hypothetical protein